MRISSSSHRLIEFSMEPGRSPPLGPTSLRNWKVQVSPWQLKQDETLSDTWHQSFRIFVRGVDLPREEQWENDENKRKSDQRMNMSQVRVRSEVKLHCTKWINLKPVPSHRTLVSWSRAPNLGKHWPINDRPGDLQTRRQLETGQSPRLTVT